MFLLIFINPILRVFGVTETAYEYAFEYYKIVVLGCLFQGLAQFFCEQLYSVEIDSHKNNIIAKRNKERKFSWYISKKK